VSDGHEGSLRRRAWFCRCRVLWWSGQCLGTPPGIKGFRQVWTGVLAYGGPALVGKPDELLGSYPVVLSFREHRCDPGRALELVGELVTGVRQAERSAVSPSLCEDLR
jgi:hypothetical protein